jgi:hypothetical protein
MRVISILIKISIKAKQILNPDIWAYLLSPELRQGS